MPKINILINVCERYKVCEIGNKRETIFNVRFGCTNDKKWWELGWNDKNNVNNAIIICINEKKVVSLQPNVAKECLGNRLYENITTNIDRIVRASKTR